MREAKDPELTYFTNFYDATLWPIIKLVCFGLIVWASFSKTGSWPVTIFVSLTVTMFYQDVIALFYGLTVPIANDRLALILSPSYYTCFNFSSFNGPLEEVVEERFRRFAKHCAKTRSVIKFKFGDPYFE